MLIEIVGASGLVVDLEEAKSALRVDHDDDDGRIEALIRSETVRFERFVRRRIAKVTLEAAFCSFGEPLVLPVGPLRSIVEVAYLDEDHVRQTVASPNYFATINETGRAEIRFVDAWTAPLLSDRPDPVFVQFVAGLDDPNDSGSEVGYMIEERDKICILQLVASLYDHGKALTEAEMRQTMGDRRVML